MSYFKFIKLDHKSILEAFYSSTGISRVFKDTWIKCDFSQKKTILLQANKNMVIFPYNVIEQ